MINPYKKNDSILRANNEMVMCIRQPLSIQWEPKEDITTFELAQALRYLLMNTPVYSENITDDSFWRHFKVNDKEVDSE